MKSSLVLITIFLFLCSASKAEEHFVPGNLIIQLELNAEASVFGQSLNITSFKPIKPLVQRMNIWLFSFDPQVSHQELLNLVKAHPDVKVAQLNHIVSRRSNIPNDPIFSNQWNLNNSGQTGGVNDADIDAAEAWDSTTGGQTALGDEIVVAVIDGGFYYTHEDMNYFKNLVEIPQNGIDDDGNGYVDDFHGWNAYNSTGEVDSFDTHGTHVAGIVGAKGNNSIGVAGVNWGLKVLPISGSSSNESTVVEAYGYVVAMRALYELTSGLKGAYIVATNSSFGVDFGLPSNYPIWCAMYDSMGKYGILSTAATMNNNSNVDQTSDVPTACASEFMIAVTNTNNNDQRSNGSAFGFTTIDIGAPGTGIVSTYPNNNYASETGTSMAAPHVAGAVALMYAGACRTMIEDYAIQPSVIAKFVKNALLTGVDTIPSLVGNIVSGGRLNLFKSLQKVKEYQCIECDFDILATINQPLCDGDPTGSINVITSGIDDQLQFLWSTGSTTEDISGLANGLYSLNIIDTAGCERTLNLAIQSPDSLSLITFFTNSETNSSKGKLLVEVSGGIAPYTYSIDGVNFQSSGFFDDLDAGNYSVTSKDANGCQRVDIAKINDITAINDPERSNGFSIYPNPAQHYLILKLPQQARQQLTIQIVNTVGQHMSLDQRTLQEDSFINTRLDISDLPSGIYFLNLRQEGELIFNKRFVVNR